MFFVTPSTPKMLCGHIMLESLISMTHSVQALLFLSLACRTEEMDFPSCCRVIVGRSDLFVTLSLSYVWKSKSLLFGSIPALKSTRASMRSSR